MQTVLERCSIQPANKGLLFQQKREPGILFAIIVAVCGFCFSCTAARAASFSGALPGLQAEQISSTAQMRTALDLIGASFAEARDRGQLTFELQKLIIAKSGECISRLSEMTQDALPAGDGRQEELRSLFKQNRETLKALHDYNQKKVEKLAEDKLDTVTDQIAFFSSPQWQEPQYLISLASYWLSWGAYYASLLYPAGDEVRTDLLNSAAAGFARTFLDFREETITTRSLFGRALCYREMGKYDRALQDMNSVAAKVGISNQLYARIQYEKIRLTFLAGNYESVLNQIRELGDDIPADRLSKQMRDGLMQMQAQIILAGMEKRLAQQTLPPRQYYRQALQELSRAAGTDEAVSAEIYRFVMAHAAEIDLLARAEGGGISDAELGGMGCLALADWQFQQKRYDDSLARYQRLYDSPDRLVRKRLDEVCFRLAWCLVEKERWTEAAEAIEPFFERFPTSALAGKSACLQYAAAANTYRAAPTDKNYGRYIASIHSYLNRCTDRKDRSEAHFHLGKYYQKTGKTDDALQEFAQVATDSPNFIEARYSVIRSHIDTLESLARDGRAGQEQAQKLYGLAQRQIDEVRPALQKMKDRSSRNELEAHITLLQARLLACSSDASAPGKALQALDNFERHLNGSRQLDQLRTSAQAIRIDALMRLGQAREAEEAISRFLKNGPDNATAWPLLNELAGRLYEQSRSLRDTGSTAEADCKAAMALIVYGRLSGLVDRLPAYAGQRDTVLLRTAQLCADTGQIGRAKQLYQDKLLRDPSSADAVSNLGQLYEQEGRWEDALGMWRRFGQGMQQGGYHWFEARFRTARCLGMLGKEAEGCQILTTTEVLHPSLRDAEYKQRFLKLHKELCGKS
jgi:tetratricopeptide (TPR) repeat protein